MTNLYIHYSVLVSYWLGEKKMNKIQLKSFWHDQTCGPIKISVLCMRVAFMIINRMNITKNYQLSNKTLEIGEIMKKNRLLHIKTRS